LDTAWQINNGKAAVTQGDSCVMPKTLGIRPPVNKTGCHFPDRSLEIKFALTVQVNESTDSAHEVFL
jgi:hypothetical protein